MLRSGAD